MIYTSQYDDAFLDMDDAFDRSVNKIDLERVFESNDYSYIADLDDIV